MVSRVSFLQSAPWTVINMPEKPKIPPGECWEREPFITMRPCQRCLMQEAVEMMAGEFHMIVIQRFTTMPPKRMEGIQFMVR